MPRSSPCIDHIGHRPLIEGAPVPETGQCNEWRRVTSVLPAGELIHHLETGVQAIQLSPYRAGLAEPALQRFQTVTALPTCCFPPRLSLRGRSVDPETSFEFLPIESGILCRVTRRTSNQLMAPPAVAEDAVGLVNDGVAFEVVEDPASAPPALGDQRGVDGLPQGVGDCGRQPVPEQLVPVDDGRVVVRPVAVPGDYGGVLVDAVVASVPVANGRCGLPYGKPCAGKARRALGIGPPG